MLSASSDLALCRWPSLPTSATAYRTLERLVYYSGRLSSASKHVAIVAEVSHLGMLQTL